MTQVIDENKSTSAKLSSQISDLGTDSEIRHCAVLTHLKNGAANEALHSHRLDDIFRSQSKNLRSIQAGFQAAEVSVRNEHEITRTVLSQYHDRLVSTLGKRTGFALVGQRVRSSPQGLLTRTRFISKYLSLSLPIGTLNVYREGIQDIDRSPKSSQQSHMKFDIKVTFVPPLWLSQIALQYALKINYEFVSNEWHWGASLRPLTINTNPFFLKAIEKFDVAAVMESFETGLARLTDYVLSNYGGPVPWYSVRCPHIVIQVVRHLNSVS